MTPVFYTHVKAPQKMSDVFLDCALHLLCRQNLTKIESHWFCSPGWPVNPQASSSSLPKHLPKAKVIGTCFQTWLSMHIKWIKIQVVVLGRGRPFTHLASFSAPSYLHFANTEFWCLAELWGSQPVPCWWMFLYFHSFATINNAAVGSFEYKYFPLFAYVFLV